MTRDSSGRLIAIDQRPVTFAEQAGSRLRWGLNLGGSVGKAPAGGGPGGPYSAYYGVVVDLSTNTTDGSARGVTISGFENVTGTEFGDILTGDDGSNIFRPLHGGGYSNTFAFGGPAALVG